MATLVVLGAALQFAASASAQAVVTAGPAGGRETETWQVVQPRCTINHDWQKSPTAINVKSITFTAGVWCQSVPSNLTVFGELDVFDQNTSARVVRANGSLKPSSAPQSFSLTPTFSSPKAGHAYESQFNVSFVDNVNFSPQGVSGAPPQCSSHNTGPDPIFESQPPVPPYPAAVDCQFLEYLAVP